MTGLSEPGTLIVPDPAPRRNGPCVGLCAVYSRR